MTAAAPCPVCSAAMRRRKPWLSGCPACRFLKADLAAGSGAEVGGIEALRRDNFETVLDCLETLVAAQGRRLLEVGCGRGWFLDAARRRGLAGIGIEPDAEAAEAAAGAGLEVRAGFFPQALRPGERFEVVVFNDVFEHLPDPAGALESCCRVLEPGGLVVLNLPSSDGVFYRIGDALERVGVGFLFERLWQKDLSSPHLSYFNPDNLCRLAGRHGFDEVARGRLETVRVGGLWRRLRGAGSLPLGAAAVVYLGVVLAAPLLGALPNDISLHFFRKNSLLTS
ncbi:MAG: class I SAM-dependent methyltransferase [bacterium]|nr:class I SAM-dependent methyltransferase [bacterium]